MSKYLCEHRSVKHDFPVACQAHGCTGHDQGSMLVRPTAQDRMTAYTCNSKLASLLYARHVRAPKPHHMYSLLFLKNCAVAVHCMSPTTHSVQVLLSTSAVGGAESNGMIHTYHLPREGCQPWYSQPHLPDLLYHGKPGLETASCADGTGKAEQAGGRSGLHCTAMGHWHPHMTARREALTSSWFS